MHLRIGITAAFLAAVAPCGAMRPSPAAERSFQSYVAKLEERLSGQHIRPETYIPLFNLAAGRRTAIERQLASGETWLVPVNGGTWEANGGLLHHWRGAVFVPGATAEEMLALLRDYKDLARNYGPQVVSSRVLADHGNIATIEMRFKERMAITVVLEAQYGVESRLSGKNRGYSYSRSAHIWQIDDPGTSRERRRAEGDSDGFLWRLNSYWSFIQWRGGLLIECEAVSLTRDIPLGLGWAVIPVIRDLPRTSLAFTLQKTKDALAARVREEANR